MYLVCKSIGRKIFFVFGFSQYIYGILSYLAKALKTCHFYPDLKDRGN